MAKIPRLTDKPKSKSLPLPPKQEGIVMRPRRVRQALKVKWQDSIPNCAPSECDDAASFGEALYFALLELDLISEGQEAAEAYTRADVKRLRKWVWDNRLTLAEFQGTTVDKLDIPNF